MTGYLEKLRSEGTEPAQVQGAAATVNTNQSPKIDEILKPEKLLRSYTLEEFNVWSEKFEAYYDHNKKTLDKSIVISRQILNNLMDSKLVNALKTEEGVKDDTPIRGDGGCLKKLKAIFLKESPLFVRRYNFLKHVQDAREPFGDWWVAKKSKARECELDKITQEDMMVLSLITGVHDPRLKEKFLRQENPTTETLVKIAESWQRAEQFSRDMGPKGANISKTGYQRGQEEKWNRDRRGGRSQTPGRRGGPSSERKPLCKTCGDSRCKGKKDCYAKDKNCKVCGKTGHFAKVCRDKDKPSTPGAGKTARTNMCRVRKTHNSHSSDYAIDDNEPIPTARMVATPLPDGRPFEIIVFPDQGSSQSIISYDIANKYGFRIDYRNKKAIHDAQHGKMDCTGSTDFEVEYEGNKTNVQALVSKSLEDECLLGWRALQRLNIIHEDFPHPIPSVAVRATTSNLAKAPDVSKNITTDVSENVPTSVEKLIEEFPKVFDTSGPLKPMKGGPMTIHMKGKVKPLHLNVPRKVAYAYQEDAKKLLDENEALGAI